MKHLRTMDSDKQTRYLDWLERLLAEHVSKVEMSSGDLRRRVSGSMTAARTLRQRAGELFGLDVTNLEPALLEVLAERYLNRFEQGVEEWRVWLETEYGTDGAETFRKIGENCGYLDIALVPLQPSPDVDAALAELFRVLDNVPEASACARKRGELEEGDSIGYYMAPATTNARLIHDLDSILPPQVAGLYARLDTLDIFTTSDAGGRSDARNSDYVLIQPLDEIEDLSDEGEHAFWTLHVHDMGTFLCFDSAGALWTWNRFQPEPTQVAPDVATYLRSLAAKYE